jgi:glycosyltransferase involved in cell wall biosynthesis
MKYLFHLLRKARLVYKERGFIPLLRRLFEYIKFTIGAISTVLTLRPANVLYVSGCPGGSCYYRCTNQSEELEQIDVSTKIINQNIPFLRFFLKQHQVFILQRVIVHKSIQGFLRELKENKKVIFFETDDLVFNPAYLPYMDYYNYMQGEEKLWYENGIGREILEDPYVKNVVVSTDFLARAMEEKYPDKKVWVSYNKMGSRQVIDAENAYQNKENIKKKDDKIRLGYFSGSRSHNKDFECIADAIVSILKNNPQVVLFIVGYLDLDSRFDDFKKQIEYAEFVPLHRLPELILTSDINLAPLELDNPFCQGKSALKYWEAGLVGVPTIASPTEDFVRCIENEKNGFLAISTEEWMEYINLLVKDEILREKVGTLAREDALKNHITKGVKPSSYILFLQSLTQKISSESEKVEL